MKFARHLYLVVALAAVAPLAVAPVLEAHAQQHKRTTKTTKPAAKSREPQNAAADDAKKDAQSEPMTPSQIGIDTLAREAYLVDFNTGTVLLSKDADVHMKPSSMAKMMTIYLLWEALKAGKVNLDTEFRVSEAAWRMQGSKMFVALGSQVAVRDLIPGIIVHSGNDAAVVVAEGLAGSQEAFAELMNRKAQQFGMKNSFFTNPDGWPDDREYVTAHDLAILAERTIRDFPDYYKRWYGEREFKYQNYDTQFNRNGLLGKVAGADGLKTGHTEEAGYGLTASAERQGRRVILVVNGLESAKQRFQEPERLIEWAFREFDDYQLFKAGDIVARADVWMGMTDKVPLTVASDAVFTLPRAARASLKATVVYDGPIKAPIAKGQQIGKLVVEAPNLPPANIPLLAAQSVDKIGFVGRVMGALKYYVLGQKS